MRKIFLFIISLSLSQIAFSQGEKMEIEGALILSNSEDPTPEAGTIRWTGQDFEGFDGTQWKSLTNCYSNPQSSDAIITCPSNFTLDNCNLTVNWSHINPTSTTVNYDLRLSISGSPTAVDPGPSVIYPASSNTVNWCSALGISSGMGSIDIELLYWYDGDTNAQLSAGTCTVNYDLSTPSGSGSTFSQIEATSDLPNFCNQSDDEYIAEYLYQNPNVYYWSVQTLANGEKQVTDLPVPIPPASAIQLPAPSGGDDTAALESVINGNGTNKAYVGSGTYKVNQLDINISGTTIYNMPVTPASGAGELIHLNADDIRLIDCPQDFQNQGSTYLGVRAYYADRFHLIRSGAMNMYHTGSSSGGGVLIRECADFHVAGGIYKNLFNLTNGSSTCRANAFWIAGGAWTDGGYFVNNIVENLQSGGQGKDAEVLTVQSNSTHLKQINVFANRCIDAGKRLIKAQADGGITTLSNYYEWKTNSTSAIGNRTRLAVIAVHFNMGDIIVRNNRIVVNGNRNWSYIMNVASTNQSGTNIHFDCNSIEINNPWNGASYDQVVLVGRSLNSGSSGSDSSQENINCSMDDNTIFGTGGVNYHYWFGDGYDVNSGLLQPAGNTFNLSDPQSPHQGIERQ